MPSQRTFIHKACPAKLERSGGFTLIEILIVLAIFGILLMVGVVAGVDSMMRYNFHAEIDNAIALLQKARSESINNIGGVAHGVHFPCNSPCVPSDPDNLVIFNGGSAEFKIAKNPTATYAMTSGDINFEQLSGIATGCPCTIAISDGVRNNTITINHEGGIDY